jgi:spermidine/putrescine transport system ATP-binding protein
VPHIVGKRIKNFCGGSLTYANLGFLKEFLCVMEKEVIINLTDVSKSFDGEMVLDHINLKIHDKEFVTLLGPSGCGKTTTLRIIGGFETPDTGDVQFDGKSVKDVPPDQRPVNTVFQ